VENAVLTGTNNRYFVPEFEGCLSIKTVVRGSYALSYGAITTSAGSTHQVGFVQVLVGSFTESLEDLFRIIG